MLFPTLYKSTATGKVQEWSIEAGSCGYNVVWGQKGGKLQTSYVKVEQKNVGRANETSLAEQAKLEAESLWKKKQDSGYREDVKHIQLAKTYLPMLAKSYKDQAHKIKWPCFVQPKLDGLRCLALASDDDNVLLLSRKGKQFNTVDHIKNEINHLCTNPDVIFDGELYVHGKNFQELIHAIKRDEQVADSALIEYHIYDAFFLDKPNQTFELRFRYLESMLGNHQGQVKLVNTYTLNSEDDVQTTLEGFENVGYEGIMLRNKDGLYEQNRRSHNLQKVKSFMDEEFEIVGVKEGKGKFEGCAIFQCITNKGAPFDCTPKCTEEQKKKYWKERDRLIGKLLTVKFFDWTVPTEKNPLPVPKFHVGIAVRDYE